MKKIIALSLAVLSAVMITGCSANTANSSSFVGDIASSETETSATEATTTPKPETSTITTTTTTETTTTTKLETTTVTAETTTAETTVPETTTATVPSVSAELPAPEWTENEASGTKYVNTSCFSRERAVPGSATAGLYNVNDKVTVIALTDTGYYKLEDGTFIHSDFLSDKEIEVSSSGEYTTISYVPGQTFPGLITPPRTIVDLSTVVTRGHNAEDYLS